MFSSPLEFQAYFSSPLFTNHKVSLSLLQSAVLLCSSRSCFTAVSPPAERSEQGLQTLKMSTEMFAEKLENIQRSKWYIPRKKKGKSKAIPVTGLGGQ
jgi:hypothetical protein